MTTHQTHGYETYEQPSGWTGWIFFASVMMMIGGVLNLVYGLVALLNDTWAGWDSNTSTAVLLDLTEWGWAHIILGALLTFAGLGVLTGNIVARTIGVIVAGLSMMGNFFFMPVYPLWAITIIAIDVLVIWALTAHGHEMRTT